MLLEIIIHKPVNDWVSARVTVTYQLKKGYHYSGVVLYKYVSVNIIIKRQVDLTGKERQPTQRKEDNNDNKHSDHPLFLFESSFVLSPLVVGVTDDRPEPETVGYFDVGHKDDDHRNDVKKGHVRHGVSDFHPSGWKVFLAHCDKFLKINSYN